MEQIQVVNKDGYYDCDINISTEEWINILGDSDLTPSNTWKALLGFYNSPNHTANCKELDIGNPNAYKNPISSFGKRVQDKLNRFQVLTTKGKDGDYFIIPMKGFDKKSAFEWTVRPELVKAIAISLKFQEKLIPEAIEQYKQKLRNDPTYWEGDPNDKKKFGEKYKWEAIAHFLNHWQDVEASKFAEMFDNATEKTKNLLAAGNSLPRKMILIVAKHKPQEIKEMFQKLYENNDNFNLDDQDSVSRVRECIEGFIQEAKNLTPIIKNLEKPDQENYKLFQDTNAVSTYLWLRYPDLYYKYAYGIYNSVRQKLGLYQYFIIDDGSVDSVLQGFAMYDKIRAMLKNDKELVEMINSRVENLHLEKDFVDDFRTATIDFGYFVSKHFHPNTQQIQESTTMFENPYQDIVDLLEYKKNIILQGAPGTGKTYSTAAIALGILGVDVDFNDHKAVMEKYEEYRKEKRRIFFTTFHQSMDYEDFVEGVKPEVTDEGVKYIKEKGIFRKVCENASSLFNEKRTKEIDFTNTRIFKMSLGQKNKDDVEVFDYCKENNVIALGWGGDKDFSNCQTRKDFQKSDNTWGAKAMEIFKCWMRVGDIVLVSDGNTAVKAIARIIGDYEFHDDAPIDMCQFRKVEWLYTGNSIPISKLYDKNLSQQSIYAFYSPEHEGTQKFNGGIKTDMINDIITAKVNTEKPLPHVLIIDEINRGNVSKIFGELVTLLEADKRNGCDHPITVILPYSKEEFSVPSNVYIIGTMNTTDRSTGTIDYAVRRRFAFVTIPTKKDAEQIENLIKLEAAKNLYKDIKDFIYKKHPQDMDINDLMVGHSYFMTEKEDELKLKIQYEVIPLLKEYLNDGLLTCSQEELGKHIESWIKLETYKQDSNTTANMATSESETSQSNE